MKKYLAILAFLTIAATAGAYNNTKIGSTHAIDFGIYYGYGSGPLCHHAGGFLDINARRSNFRTRLNLEIEQVAISFCPSGSVEFMYLVPLDKTLCLYPLAGFQMDYHNEPRWAAPIDFGPAGGLGLEFQISKNFGYFIQTKYRYGLNGTGSCIMGQTGFVFAFGPGKRGPVEVSANGTALAESLRARDAADDARRAEALKNAQAEAAKAAAEAKAKAAAEAAAQKAAALKAAEERMADQIILANVKAAEAAKKPIHEDIFFRHASASLDENAWQQIEDIIAYLTRYPETKVSLCGYADKSEGPEASCERYAQKRVDAIAKALKDRGIEEGRITSETIGSAIAPYQMPESNRVVIVDTHHQ